MVMSTEYIRSTLVNGDGFLKAGDIFGGRTNAPGVGVQDKATPGRSYTASGEPHYNSSPAQLPEEKHHGSNTRQGGQAAGYYTHEELAIFERMRGTGENRPSRSKIVTKLTRLGLAVSRDKEDFATLEPRLEHTLVRLFTAFSDRYASLLAKLYNTAKRGELKTEAVLRLAYLKDPDGFHTLVEKIQDEASLSLGDKHNYHHA
jgi:hypothetical protein